MGLISGVISHMVQDDLGVCSCQSNIILEASNCSISVLCSKIEFHGKQNRGCIRLKDEAAGPSKTGLFI